MKKILFILLFGFIFSACGNDAPELTQAAEQAVVEDSIPTLQGEFIFLSGAAVLKGEDFIYGVNIDSTALDLAETVKKFKNDDFDMVPVVVKAKVMQNPKREGWDEIIEIKEIVEIPVVGNSPNKSEEESE